MENEQLLVKYEYEYITPKVISLVHKTKNIDPIPHIFIIDTKRYNLRKR